MAHRKLQQEIDRVFKKISEGLDIFNTYHERHESASNTSQKDKLENDLKREIKKLQKLREQIKVWQTSSDVKDKDKLLEHRRLVEVAMEQYKVIEKGSKVKAYSNTSLKAVNDLDPEEQEKQECINFIQDSIDDLETQYQNCEVEMDKLSSKKSKKSLAANEAKKEELKEIQTKYRWHQQNLELALRLLENDELVPDDINEIKEDLVYFLTSNRDPNFIENEYLYESLDLDANEILQHEVVTSFNGLNEKERSPTPEEPEPTPKSKPISKPTPVESITPKKEKSSKMNPLTTTNVSPSPFSQPPTPVSTHGLTSTLKPAITPVKPPQTDMKWSSLVAGVVPEVPTSSKQPDEVPTPTENVVVKQQQPLQTSIPADSQRIVPTRIDDSNYLIDSAIISLPPGIQDIILSFYSNRCSNTIQPKQEGITNGIGSHRIIKNISNYLNQSRYYLFNNNNNNNNSNNNSSSFSSSSSASSSSILPRGTSVSASPSPSLDKASINSVSSISSGVSAKQQSVHVNYSKDLSLEFQKCLNEWNKARSLLNFSNVESSNLSNEQILSSLDLSTLFYGYYYSLTPFESRIISEELRDRGWYILDGGKSWESKKSNENDQINGIERLNRFDVESWNLVEILEKSKKQIISW